MAVSFESHPFWDFSYGVYGKDGVSPALIGFQDRHGMDVNMLFLCLWMGHSGRGVLNTTAMAQALAVSHSWNPEIVCGLRALRIRLRDPNDAPEVAKRVGQLTGYKAVSWQEANADLMSAFGIRNVIMVVIMSAMMFASTLGIYSIISTITQEKRHDIAIMKSFGMRAGLVLNIFLVESAIMGILGVVIGWLFGYVLCIVMTQVTVANPITGDAVPLPLAFEPVHYVVVAGISLAACLVAAFFPSQKASRLLPVDIIRGVA